MKENIIQKIIDNRNKIVGIEIDGNFYNVDYIPVVAEDKVVLHCYTTDTDRKVTENYYFYMEDIKNAKEIKLYRLEEIKDER